MGARSRLTIGKLNGRLSLAIRTGVTDQFQLISLRIMEKKGPRGHCRKLDLTRIEAEDFESLFVSFVTVGWNLES